MIDLFEPSPIIRVIDFEATGLEPDADVCEVGWCDVSAAGGVLDGGSYLCRVATMPPATRAVHHIRAEETWAFPPYDRRCLYEHAARDGVTCLAAHNAPFEEKFILGNIPMVCTDKAARRWWDDAPGYNVFALLYWLEDQERVEFDQVRAHPPHRAGPDAYATAVLLSTMLTEGVSGAELFRFTREPRFMRECPIGQWRGRRWEDVDFGFLRWVMDKVDDKDIRWNAARELDRRSSIQ